MFRFIIICFTSLLFVFSAKSQSRYIDPVFDSVTKHTFTYSKIQDTLLKLDIYQPAKDPLTKRPLMLLVHGGGFNSGKRDDTSIVYMANNIAQKGYVVASVDYRQLRNSENLNCDVNKKFKLKTIEKATQDVAEALLYLINYNVEFKIDETKIILYGSSAGAEIILNLAYNKSLVLNPKYISQLPEIAAVISVSGAVLDISSINKTDAIPGVFYHGTLDTVVPYSSGSHHSCSELDKGYLPEYGSNAIVERLKKLNRSFLFYSYLNRKHDIFNLPTYDFKHAFYFIKRVIIDNDFYQATIIE